MNKHFISIGVMNTLDGLFTYYGLKYEFMEEANPLLSSLEPMTILIIKLFFSFLVFGLCFFSFRENFAKKFRIFLNFALLIYVFVLSLHLFWLIPFVKGI